MKKKLLALLAKKEARKNEIVTKSASTEDVAELRAINTELEALNAEIAELRSMIEAIPDEPAPPDAPPVADRTAAVNGDVPNIVVAGAQAQEKRKIVNDVEQRAAKLAETGSMTIGNEEARSILVGSGSLAKSTGVGGINDPFNVVSSIIDMVSVEDLTGMGSYKEAYISAWQTADTAPTNGTAPNPNDPAMKYVAINPYLVDTLTYVDKNLKKQTPLAYEQKVRQGALIALRKRVVNWIVKGNGTTQAFGIINAVNAETEPESMTQELLLAANTIDATTLRKIVFAYGGDENIGAGARLFLNKLDLIAFGDVRGTNEKQAVYEITPDGANPNIGTIKDGGLTVPYCICSDVTALSTAVQGAAKIKTMLYGAPGAYKLGLFGDYEVNVSADYKFAEGLLAVKGEVMVGGNVVMDKGFVVVTLDDNV